MSTSFFTTGGNLRPDDPTYVERKADGEILTRLRNGEFCYMLDSRQVGKSSLMVRTVLRLRAEGVKVCVIDLQSVGNTLTQDQWYAGLLYSIGRELDCEDALDRAWSRIEKFGPYQRWMAAFTDVILPALGEGRLVIFIDEIDIVRSLNFSSDEFFLGIREMFNKRSLDPRFERLTFCLVGSASPADLIKDKTVTPFNIGSRIELTDFTAAEASPLAKGFEYAGNEALAVLSRVLHWTGGHPYLTQKLCLACAEARATSNSSVDEQCAKLFFTDAAKDQDPNLTYVRDRLLKTIEDIASVLLMLRQIRTQSVAVDETSEAQGVIRLSGIVATKDRMMQIRNGIYRKVFDDQWINRNLPEREAIREERVRVREAVAERKVRKSYRTAVIIGLSIVAVAAAVIVPVVIQSKIAQKRVESLSTLKQVALAFQLYASDWDDMLPDMRTDYFETVGVLDNGTRDPLTDIQYQEYQLVAMRSPRSDGANSVWDVVQPYLKFSDVPKDSWEHPVETNIIMSHWSITSIAEPATSPLFWTQWSAGDAEHIMSYADSNTKWQPTSKFPEVMTNFARDYMK